MVKNLFITGGLGQDGKIIYKLLKRKKLNISIITKSKEVNVDKKIDYKILNLLNKKKIETIFKKKNQILFFTWLQTTPLIWKIIMRSFIKII